MKTLLPNQKGASQVLAIILVVVIVAFGVFLLINPQTKFNFSNLQNNFKSKLTQLASHYSLSLVGYQGVEKKENLASEGAAIFIPLDTDCMINLTSGEFKVSDSDCIDETTTTFSLPANSTGEEDATTYAVFVKILDAKLSTPNCKKDENGDDTGTFCPTSSMLIVRAQDTSFSSDVTKVLQDVYYDLDTNGNMQRYHLFDEKLKDRFWMDVEGRRVVNLRFYPQSADALEKEAALE